MKKRSTEDVVVYQQRARDFNVGDNVAIPGGPYTVRGRVTQVHKGIGVVDVEFPDGNKKVPVENLILVDKSGKPSPPGTNSAPVSKTIRASLKEACGSDCGCGGNCTCGGNCGCGSKSDPQDTEGQIRFVVKMSKNASGRPLSRKKFALDAIFESDLPNKLKVASFKKALSHWWSHDSESISDLFQKDNLNLLKKASFHNAVKRLSEGKKPFIASAWSMSKKGVLTRNFVLNRRETRVASAIYCNGNGEYIWEIGNKSNSRGKCASLDEALKAADAELSIWGFALR